MIHENKSERSLAKLLQILFVCLLPLRLPISMCGTVVQMCLRLQHRLKVQAFKMVLLAVIIL